MILDLDDEFTFGKFEGYTVQEVIDEDPDYVNWCVENLDNVIFTEDVEKLV